jgi:general nucleoside transport system permease protein
MENIFIVGLLAATLRVATPLIFGTLGELFSERSGVLNLGIEGIMFLGAFVGFTVAETSGSLWLGVGVAIVAGVIAGWVMSLMTVRLGVNQHVSGLGLTLLWTAISLFGFRLIFGAPTVMPSIDTFPTISPFQGIPYLGTIFEQRVLTYVALLLIPLVAWLINHTRFGLKIRAVGENPEAADAAGINVFQTRMFAQMIGGGLMALGGAFLSEAMLGAMSFGIISGRGWVCIALVIFANWQAIGVLWGSLLFGGFFALQLALQATGIKLPYELMMTLPYIVTILALTLAGRNVSAPSAMLKPYKRE